MEDEAVFIECPACGTEQEDFDGFGVVHCEACGYCQHISTTDGVCDICDREVDKGE
jgi:rubrerythrin